MSLPSRAASRAADPNRASRVTPYCPANVDLLCASRASTPARSIATAPLARHLPFMDTMLIRQSRL